MTCSSPCSPKQKETQVRFLGKCSLEGSRTLRKLREGVRRNLATAHAAKRQEDWASGPSPSSRWHNTSRDRKWELTTPTPAASVSQGQARKRAGVRRQQLIPLAVRARGSGLVKGIRVKDQLLLTSFLIVFNHMYFLSFLHFYYIYFCNTFV